MNREESIARLKKLGLENPVNEEGRIYLRDVDLRDADLRKADLGNANLHEANLSRANLYGANLREANLYGAILFRAILSGVRYNGSITRLLPTRFGGLHGARKGRNRPLSEPFGPVTDGPRPSVTNT